MQIDVFKKREKVRQLLRNVQRTQFLVKIKIEEYTDHIINSQYDTKVVHNKTSEMISSYIMLLQIQDIILTGLSKIPPNGKVLLSPELVSVLLDYGLIAG
ncbi:hypothetical protein [Acetobacter okinawensis]|uniref:hypothetical protein n=1 Tax=Acetobacter okinawensis TaxID=1076594 RepID=UPI001BAC1A77|nr:hypothetical protein [Acetobacter okinawensis]MBS0967149.1 hypothetical protein [Acetobacter okinawensis]MBS0989099.1 hypothetical protein [Acetobacter okinawensis]MCP1214126.1 hypothetical protein [Acetobacter okinawensis]